MMVNGAIFASHHTVLWTTGIDGVVLSVVDIGPFDDIVRSKSKTLRQNSKEK